MAKTRRSKANLVALSATALVIPSAIATTIALSQPLQSNPNQTFNQLALESGANFPNLGLANSQMFTYNPENLNTYHAGNVTNGQAITPLGWLGVYDQANGLAQRLALTAWNGEILWATNLPVNTYESIVDLKYDWSTNMVIVLTTNKIQSGLFDLRATNTSTANTNLYLIDGSSGKTDPKWKLSFGADFAIRAQQELTSSANDGALFNPKSFQQDTFDQQDNWRAKDLYRIETVGATKTNSAITMLSPNWLQLYNHSGNNAPSLKQVLYKMKNLAKGWHFDRKNNQVSARPLNFDLANLLENRDVNKKVWINRQSDTLEFNGDWVHLRNSFILANPFWSAANDGSKNWFFHIIFGTNDQQRVFHLSMKFNLFGNSWRYENGTVERLDSINGLNFKVNDKWWEQWSALSRKATFSAPANVRPNHNIFDPALVTFSYPYANSTLSNQAYDYDRNQTSFNTPIFNVAQLRFNNSDGKIILTKPGKYDSMVFPIGQQIYESLQDRRFPTDLNSLDHKFNRLLSVNPFSNEFIYATTINNSGLNVNDRNREFASFYYVKPMSTYSSGWNATPFSIKTQTTDSSMTTISKILQEGFSFDYKLHPSQFNLYFNATASAKATHGSPLGQTNKIGFLPNLSTKNITDFKSNQSVANLQIDPYTYGALIHDRIKLASWFNQNPYQFLNPPTMWAKDFTVSPFNSDFVTIDQQWKIRDLNANLQNQAFLQRAYNLVSHAQNTNNSSHLMYKNPAITINERNGAWTTQNKITLRVSYGPQDQNIGYYATWLPAIFKSNQQARQALSDGFDIEIDRPAIQVMNQFGNQHKVQSILDATSNSTSTIQFQTVGSLQPVFSIRQNNAPQAPFGKVNNAVNINNRNVLRPLVQIVKPSAPAGKTLPKWLKDLIQNQPQLWQPAPLNQDRLQSETGFETLISQYQDLILKNYQNYENYDPNQIDYGLANIQIMVTMGLNPLVAKNQTIYQFANQFQAISGTDGTNYIYYDYLNPNQIQKQLIYNQSAPDFATLNQYGTGSKANVKANWINDPQGKVKLMFQATTEKLAWPLLNPGASFANKQPILAAKYVQDMIILQPLNQASAQFKNLMTTFSYKLGLRLNIEAKKANQSTWSQIASNLDDQAILKTWDQNQNGFKFATQQNDFEQLRIRLSFAQNDANQFVKWTPYGADELRLTSAIHPISAKPYVVDPTWFSTSTLSSNLTLEQISTNEFNGYENEIKTQFLKVNGAQGQNAWNQIDILYSFNGSDYRDQNQTISAIKQALNDFNNPNRGWFTLWNGSAQDTKGQLVLKAKFAFKPGVTNGAFSDQNGNLINDENRLSAPVKSDIKTKFDVQPYFATLLANPLVTTQNDRNEITAIQFPIPDQGRFAGFDFNAIQQFFYTNGLKMQFAQWNRMTNQWDQWNEDLNSIKTYDQSQPSFKMRIQIRDAAFTNVGLYDANDLIDGNYQGRIIKLQLPKLVKVNPDFQSQISNLIKTNPPFSGNTWQLNPTANLSTFEAAIKAAIISASTTNANEYQSLNQVLAINYQLANSGFMSASALSQWAKGQDQDLNTNQIEIQISLINQNQHRPEYVLDPSLDQQNFILYANQNTDIKIYVHGRDWKAQLNSIKATGSTNQLVYDWTNASALEQFIKTDQTLKGVKLEWKFANANQWKVLNQTNSLPNSLSTNLDASAINLRLVDADPNDYYQFENNNREGQIDLSALNQLVYVDPKWFNQTDFANVATVDQINLDVLNQYEQTIQSQISNFKVNQNVNLEFALVAFNQNQINWQSGSDLINTLNQLQQNFADPDQNGIVQLSNQSQLNHYQILAKFTTNDPKITFVDDQGQILNDQQLSSWIDVQQIKTNVDLTHYVQVLKTNLATVVVDPNQVEQIQSISLSANDKGQWVFSGQTFNDIETKLAQLKITIYVATTAKPVASDWIRFSDLQTYDPNLRTIKLAFVNDSSSKINLKIDQNITTNPGANNQDQPITIKLNVPKVLNLASQWFNQFINDHGFNGNTKDLIIDQTKIDKLLVDLQSQLAAINQDFANAPLMLQWQLGATTWVSASQLQSQLANATYDQTSRGLKLKVVLDPSANPQEWILQGTAVSQPLTIFDENNSPLKIFLHDQGTWNAIQNVQLSGSDQALVWNWQALNVNPNNGLITNKHQNQIRIEYQFDQMSNWTPVQPDHFDPQIKSGKIRLNWIDTNANQKYTFGSADPANSANDSTILKPITLDLNQLKTTLKLSSTWLKQIQLGGNLIDLTVDESQLLTTLKANLHPSDAANIAINYTIDGKTWFEKDQFIPFLKTNAGKESNQRFILKREAIQARFSLKPGISNDHYNWIIDNQVINDLDQFNQFSQQLIDPTTNVNVKGVINLDHVPSFQIANFSIVGTNLKPQLVIKDQSKIANAFNVYASDHFFKIELTNQLTGSNWDWTNAMPIWQNGQFNLDLTGLTINKLKQVAIRLIINDQNYYLKDHSNQLVFDLSNQVQITTQIINPFGKNQSALAIQVRDDNGQAKWMQNQGQFKIMLGNQHHQVDPRHISAWDYLNQQLANDEVNALEFVYQIFDHQPSAAEIKNQSAQDVVNDPSSAWKIFNWNNWSQGLNLKVGDYVMVALRVKANQNGYQLDQNSVLIPVNDQASANQPIAIKAPGRISGLLVDPEIASLTNFNLTSLIANQPDLMLDGATKLDRLILNQKDNHYLGINLKISQFTNFHLDQSGKVLTTPSGTKLVQRTQVGMVQGAPYLDQSGNPIVDANGKTVYLWVDPNDQNHPAQPLETNQATRSQTVSVDSQGQFNLSWNDQWTLFKNQRVEITYQAKVGLGDAQNPDFELKNTKVFDLKPQLDPILKFSLENPANIKYDWNNRDAFSDQNVQFAPTDGSQIATNGAARVATILELKRVIKTNQNQSSIISGQDGFAAMTKISEQIETDFAGQIKVQFQHISKDGRLTTYDHGNFYQLDQLQNGDQIRLNLIPIDDQLVFLDGPKQLIINVNGLATVAPDRKTLKFLRVEQSGKIDGQGSFRILVNDPNGPINNNDQILKGWKFLIRVWDLNRAIKINWTDDQSLITNLNNGDRVEWKLVDANKNPVTDAYYNTIAITHDEANGIYNYGQVNYPNGQSSLNVIKNEIGSYPLDETKYPETSGFVISNLVAKDQIKPFNLTQFAFEKIIKTLNPTYYGQNGNGALRFNEQYLSGNWYVDLEGNLYQNPKYENQVGALQEISLTNFFANTTFYLQNPVTNPAQVGFKFKANLTNTGNQLKNGDQVYAQFDIEGAGWSAITGLNEVSVNTPPLSATLVSQLPDVSNLVDSSDPFASFWWILMIIASLGLAALIGWIVHLKRHSKLNVKNVKRK